ncbi:asparagine--tRNA ligase SLM5 Ecym_1359 [Eremothecium cymbalariae DBVPG|uniref:Asparagine--tRNA ligase, mitochondrial n=1 Tax=Eremothecium cymbalariae (strain CBS 270.75 / DBVPG 7215 / KCTC 17166 / NRRL Y-17582) TaxID=931890 RepID=G8JNC8_ERECY|nr:hypothetical protein Ecym_1359 [Eremothecium cymbalariae DBVPG\
MFPYSRRFLSSCLNARSTRSIRELLQIKEVPVSPIEVKGWIKSFRALKKVSFIDLYDGTTNETLKVVIPITACPEVQGKPSLKTGQSVVIKNAHWKWTPNREQSFELSCSRDDVEILGEVGGDFPLQKKYVSLKQLRKWPLWKHRTTYLASLLRFRSYIETELTKILSNESFFKVQPPILTGSDCEGGGELFYVESNDSRITPGASKMKYFGQDTYLTVSTQLHLEVLALAMRNVWTLSPCFRAEKSDTNRHLSEFWMLEAEMCFVDDVRVLTQFVEDIIKNLVRSLLLQQNQLLPQLVPEEGADATEEVIKQWNSLINDKWTTITYTEAIELLVQRHSGEPFNHIPRWGNALQAEHEKWLSGTKFGGPVFVIDYPKDCKAFYMKVNSDNKTVACFDLLVPDMGEVVGGSVREDDYRRLIAEMEARKMNIQELYWYTELRKHGSVPHSGFGLGMERLVSWLYGNHNIRDAVPFHRAARSTIHL